MERRSALESWRHCPRCAGPLEPEESSVRCPACGFSTHANPAPTASAIVVDDRGRVLLARRANDPGKGKWDLLGGFMDEGERPVETLRRELREEIGVDARLGEFVGGFPDRYGEEGGATINFYWTARIEDEPSPATDELEEVRWFEADALPAPDDFAFANTVEALGAWRNN